MSTIMTLICGIICSLLCTLPYNLWPADFGSLLVCVNISVDRPHAAYLLTNDGPSPNWSVCTTKQPPFVIWPTGIAQLWYRKCYINVVVDIWLTTFRSYEKFNDRELTVCEVCRCISIGNRLRIILPTSIGRVDFGLICDALVFHWLMLERRTR